MCYLQEIGTPAVNVGGTELPADAVPPYNPPNKSRHDAMTTFDDISRILHDHLGELRRIYGVAEIGVFGSFVRGEQQENSDVDVLVECSRPVGFVAFMRLEVHLQGLLGRKVDLVSKKALKPYIGRRILEEVRYVA